MKVVYLRCFHMRRCCAAWPRMRKSQWKSSVYLSHSLRKLCKSEISVVIHRHMHRWMRKLHVLSATWRWHRSYRTLRFLRLFSVCSCLKITHCDTYSGRIWKDFVHQCKVLDISSVFSIKIPQDAHTDNVFFCQNSIENCTPPFLRFDVNGDKSDVMTSFDMIDWSEVCQVFWPAGSSLTERPKCNVV
jgi:hypothetical protein